jgi:hypothetical protein
MIHVLSATPGKKTVVEAAVRRVHPKRGGGVERVLLVGVESVHVGVAREGGREE